MELEGTLKQFALSELLAMMVSNMVTGVLAVSIEGESGYVFSRNGRLVHASFGDMWGMSALERMAEMREARFRFVIGAKPSEESLWGDSWLVLGMVMRHERLLQRIREWVPSLFWVPVLRAEGGSRGVRLPAAAWPLLASIDGQRNVGEIAAHLDYDRANTALGLFWLARRGLITLHPPRRSPSRSVIKPLQTLSVAR